MHTETTDPESTPLDEIANEIADAIVAANTLKVGLEGCLRAVVRLQRAPHAEQGVDRTQAILGQLAAGLSQAKVARNFGTTPRSIRRILARVGKNASPGVSSQKVSCTLRKDGPGPVPGDVVGGHPTPAGSASGQPGEDSTKEVQGGNEAASTTPVSAGATEGIQTPSAVSADPACEAESPNGDKGIHTLANLIHTTNVLTEQEREEMRGFPPPPTADEIFAEQVAASAGQGHILTGVEVATDPHPSVVFPNSPLPVTEPTAHVGGTVYVADGTPGMDQGDATGTRIPFVGVDMSSSDSITVEATYQDGKLVDVVVMEANPEIEPDDEPEFEGIDVNLGACTIAGPRGVLQVPYSLAKVLNHMADGALYEVKSLAEHTSYGTPNLLRNTLSSWGRDLAAIGLELHKQGKDFLMLRVMER